MDSRIATAEQQAELDQLTEDWELSRILQLPPEPTVVIAGAYKGKLMQWFAEKYPLANIYGYEPQPWAYEEATTRLKPYADTISWTLSPLALGIRNATDVPMGDWGTDGCSFLTTEREQGKAALMVDARDELVRLAKDNHNKPIDLLIINMEGYEFQLVPHIFDTLETYVGSVAIQFHPKYMTSYSQYAGILYVLDDIYPHHFNYFLPQWGYWF